MRIDRDRLVDAARRMIGTPSFTGDEQAMAELMAETLDAMGLHVQWQQVEEGRANVLATRAGAGGGRSLMFNGHMDTSYSGREPWLRAVPGFQPQAFERDGRLYGLGISNMKGALACYVEALRALEDARRAAARRRARRGRVRRDREGPVRGGAGRAVPRLRRRLPLPRHPRRRRRHVPARRADGGQGRARSLRLALGAHPRARGLHPHRVQRGPGRPQLDPSHARRARGGEGVDPGVGERPVERVPRREGDRQRRRDRGRVRLAGLSHAAPHGSLPRRARAADEADGDGARGGSRDGPAVFRTTRRRRST